MQIYKITNLLTGKMYVGKDETSNPDYFGSGVLIRKAIKKYGKENFKKEILAETDDKFELRNLEKYFIQTLESYRREIGYNISLGGDGGDTISNNPNRAEIIAKISKLQKGIPKSKEHIEALKKAHPRLKMEDKNMDKESWLKNIRAAHSKRKGKSLEEIVGEERAREIKLDLREKRKLRDDKTPVAKFTKDGRLIAKYESQQQAALEENLRQGDISNCITGRQKTVKGFIWKAV